jgi:hypothetical protein
MRPHAIQLELIRPVAFQPSSDICFAAEAPTGVSEEQADPDDDDPIRTRLSDFH